MGGGHLRTASQTQTETTVAQDDGPPEPLLPRGLDVFAGPWLTADNHGVLNCSRQPEAARLGLFCSCMKREEGRALRQEKRTVFALQIKQVLIL